MATQEEASIIKFCIENCGVNNIAYFLNEVQQGFTRPSLYFPNTDRERVNHTTSGYQNTNTWFINVFAEKSSEAEVIAARIYGAINNNNEDVPLVDMDGNSVNIPLRIRNISYRKTDQGVIMITIEWWNFNNYSVAASTPIQNYNITKMIKE